MSNTRRTMRLVLGAVLAVGCGRPDAGPAGDAAPPRAIADAGSELLPIGTDSIALDEIARIGELDGAPEYAFGEVISIAVRADRGFYACDRQDVSIRLYDSTARFIARVGRKGEGPAEYSACYVMSIVGDSILWVTDFGARFVGFGLDGTSRGVMRSHLHTNPRHVDSQGRFWWGRMDVSRYERGVEKQLYVATDRRGNVVDSLVVPASRIDLANRPFAISTIEGVYVSLPQDTMWSIGADGSRLIALPSLYHIDRSGGERAPLAFTREASPVAYLPEEREEWDAWRLWTDESSRRMDRRYGPAVVHGAIPETKPFVRDVRGDERGRIWVQVHVKAEKRDIPPRPPGNRKPLLTWRERTTYEIFDGSRGEYVGRVALPHATELMATRGDRIWARTEGPDGEQVLVVYQMRPARQR